MPLEKKIFSFFSIFITSHGVGHALPMVNLKWLALTNFNHSRASRHGLVVVSAVSTNLHPFSLFFQLNIKRYKKTWVASQEAFFKVNGLTNAFTFQLDQKGSRWWLFQPIAPLDKA